jgi:hypothetical protein
MSSPHRRKYIRSVLLNQEKAIIQDRNLERTKFSLSLGNLRASLGWHKAGKDSGEKEEKHEEEHAESESAAGEDLGNPVWGPRHGRNLSPPRNASSWHGYATLAIEFFHLVE